MSAATKAKSARARANIAARMIRAGRGLGSRAYDDCFEMGDGGQVVELLAQMARTDAMFAADVLSQQRYIGSPVVAAAESAVHHG